MVAADGACPAPVSVDDGGDLGIQGVERLQEWLCEAAVDEERAGAGVFRSVLETIILAKVSSERKREKVLFPAENIY